MIGAMSSPRDTISRALQAREYIADLPARMGSVNPEGLKLLHAQVAAISAQSRVYLRDHPGDDPGHDSRQVGDDLSELQLAISRVIDRAEQMEVQDEISRCDAKECAISANSLDDYQERDLRLPGARLSACVLAPDSMESERGR